MNTEPKVASLMIRMANHAAPLVRQEAATWLTSTWAIGVRGTLERAMTMVKRDPDAAVRAYACGRLGRRVDERALPTLRKLVGAKMAAKDPELYRQCMQGLSEMFLQWPHAEHSSKKGFDLFVDALASRPCTEHAPPWGVISGLRWAAKDGYVEHAPWFPEHRQRLTTALGQVVTCKGANWMARTNAVEVLTELGATPAFLSTLLKTVRARPDAPGAPHVIAALEKVAR
jgi:hypothetical protein